MSPTLALAGDTMLGRGVAETLTADPGAPLLADEVAAHLAAADAAIVNLECCISERGTPFADPFKPFFFRAPPVAATRLAELGVDAVSLANNHALDFGPVALLDTLDALAEAGIAAVGAGPDERSARAPVVVRCGAVDLRVAAVADHPEAYAATDAQPGIAYADLRDGVPGWLCDAARPGDDAGAVLVTPHWGPNMVAEPRAWVREAAHELVASGATLVAGHSAHVFQGVAGPVLFDLGDFVDDYARHPVLRNDLGLLWLVEFDAGGPRQIRVVPLELEYAHTRLARGEEAAWIAERLRALCAPFGTGVEPADGMLEVVPAA